MAGLSVETTNVVLKLHVDTTTVIATHVASSPESLLRGVPSFMIEAYIPHSHLFLRFFVFARLWAQFQNHARVCALEMALLPIRKKEELKIKKTTVPGTLY